MYTHRLSLANAPASRSSEIILFLPKERFWLLWTIPCEVCKHARVHFKGQREMCCTVCCATCGWGCTWEGWQGCSACWVGMKRGVKRTWPFYSPILWWLTFSYSLGLDSPLTSSLVASHPSSCDLLLDPAEPPHHLHPHAWGYRLDPRATRFHYTYH